MPDKSDTPLFAAQAHALQSTCDDCGKPLEMKFGKRGPFLGCSDYPRCEFIRPLHQNDGHVVKTLDMACPQCNDTLLLRQGRYGMFIGCSAWPVCDYIASPDKKASATQLVCPECRQGHLVERQSRYGKTFYACDGYPKCRFAVNQRPQQGECAVCQYPLLIEKKTAAGMKVVCANRRCGSEQTTEVK